jgi:hypothetical protein
MPKQFQNCMRKKFILKLLGQVLSYQSKLIEPQGENSPVRPMILVGNEHAMTAFFTETTMKIKYAALLSVSTFAVALLLMAPTRGIAEALGGFEPKQLKEDFQIARHSLEEGQPGLYRYTKKADLDRIFDEAEKSLNRPMDAYEFYRVMSLPVAAIKNGHTDVCISDDCTKETKKLPWLPFNVKVLDYKPYIFRDYAKNGTLAGREILSVNGVPATRIIRTMLAAESQDGDIQSSRQRVIAQHFGQSLIALLGIKAPYEVELAGDGVNKAEKVQVAGLTQEQMVGRSKSLYPRDQDKEPSKELKFLDNGKIAHLRYSIFGTDVEEGRAFMKRTFEEIQSKGSKVLILDMRGNLGGEGELGALLFSYLVDKPFKYYDDIIINANSGTVFSFAKYTDPHRDLNIPPGIAEVRGEGRIHQIADSCLGIQQPSKPNFKGLIYALINGRCFSSGAEFLTEVHFHHRATFIGEESAGGYYGNDSGDMVRIKLPNTKLVLFIPVMSGYMSVGGTHDHEAARGVIPDFPVNYTIAELLAGADKDLDLALELARKQQ